MTKLIWGSYKGHLQHLFPGTVCVDSACGTAYCGDSGITRPSRRKLCKLCTEISVQQGVALPDLTQKAKREKRSVSIYDK